MLTGPVVGAEWAWAPVPFRLMGGAASAAGVGKLTGPVVGAEWARSPEPFRLMKGAALARGFWRGWMGEAVPTEKRKLLVPLISPTPQVSSRSACKAAPGCCALDGAACAPSFAFTRFLDC